MTLAAPLLEKIFGVMSRLSLGRDPGPPLVGSRHCSYDGHKQSLTSLLLTELNGIETVILG